MNQEGVCDPCLKFSELSGCGNFDVSTISNDNGIIINAKNDNLKLGRGEGQIDIGDMSLVIDDYFFREYKIVKKIADENMQMAWFDVYSYIRYIFVRKLFILPAKLVGANIVSLHYRFVDKKIVDRAHKNNLKIYVFSPSKKEDINKLKSFAVDGIISNYPDRI